MGRPTVTTETERIADRLLRSTAARSYDPDVDIDWSAPLVPGKGYLLPHRCSLYGTSMYDQLSKHEAVSVASTGIFLEAVLMRMLTRAAYAGDPMSSHVQYALAELGEE